MRREFIEPLVLGLLLSLLATIYAISAYDLVQRIQTMPKPSVDLWEVKYEVACTTDTDCGCTDNCLE